MVAAISLLTTLPAFGLLSACANENVSEAQRMGTLRVPLTTQSKSRATFVLTGQFAITGPDAMTLDAGGDAPSITQTLRDGSYVVELQPGWKLSRQAPDSSLVLVNATLQSAVSVPFDIHTDEVTGVHYQFLVDGEVVDFNKGSVAISIEVEEKAPPAEPTCADHVANGDESDVDCGGSCPPCAQGLHCAGDADCSRGGCALDLCGTLLSAGVVAGDLVLTQDESPYVLEGTMQVGGVLTASAGTEIFGGNQWIEVHDKLSVAGTADNPVKLHQVNVVPRGTNASRVQIEIEHAIFDGGSPYRTFPAVYGSLTLRDSVLSGTSWIYLWYPVAASNIERNLFLHAGGISVGTSGVMVSVLDNYFLEQTTDFAVTNWASYGGTFLQVHGNTFASTDRRALTLPGSDSAAMDATGNYFGTTDPAVIASMIVDRNDDLNIVSVIPFEPYLDAPTAQTPLPPAQP
jgi:hypothetical protein